jgi:hypothetical protein
MYDENFADETPFEDLPLIKTSVWDDEADFNAKLTMDELLQLRSFLKERDLWDAYLKWRDLPF